MFHSLSRAHCEPPQINLLDCSDLYNVLAAYGIQPPSDTHKSPSTNTAIQHMLDILFNEIVGESPHGILHVLKVLGYSHNNSMLKRIIGHRYTVANTETAWPVVLRALAYLARLLRRLEEPLALQESVQMDFQSRMDLYCVNENNGNSHSGFKEYLQQLRTNRQVNMVQSREQAEVLGELQLKDEQSMQLESLYQKQLANQRKLHEILAMADNETYTARAHLQQVLLEFYQLRDQEALHCGRFLQLEQQLTREGQSVAREKETRLQRLEADIAISDANVIELGRRVQSAPLYDTVQLVHRLLGTDSTVEDLIARLKRVQASEPTSSAELENLKVENQTLQADRALDGLECDRLERELETRRQLDRDLRASHAEPLTAIKEHKRKLVNYMSTDMGVSIAEMQAAARARAGRVMAAEVELPDFGLPTFDELLAKMKVEFESAI